MKKRKWKIPSRMKISGWWTFELYVDSDFRKTFLKKRAACVRDWWIHNKNTSKRKIIFISENIKGNWMRARANSKPSNWSNCWLRITTHCATHSSIVLFAWSFSISFFISYISVSNSNQLIRTFCTLQMVDILNAV